ncbi:MAG TPA: hypothetical protein PKY30_01335 [Myxococcota bacterium]|nr:hypothetical protein [Myxococcota bacterium]HND33144.1 hypothetical protein [Myxococcota bacterium]HNH45646.1 hypothetical protein [Myxococcota bacterium]
MSLVENLDQDHWQRSLDGAFSVVLKVLATDPFCMLGSSADDVRGWLTSGGLARVREGLIEQMEGRRIAETRRAEVLARCDVLAKENRAALLSLALKGAIPATPEEFLSFIGWKPEEFGTILASIRAGDRPFETAMRQDGRSEEEIAEMNDSMDRALARMGFPGRPPIHE